MTDLAYGFTYFQDTPATTWNVQHSLNLTCPVIQVFITIDGVTQRVLPLSVSIVDANNLTVTFSSAQMGFARLK